MYVDVEYGLSFVKPSPYYWQVSRYFMILNEFMIHMHISIEGIIPFGHASVAQSCMGSEYVLG